MTASPAFCISMCTTACVGGLARSSTISCKCGKCCHICQTRWAVLHAAEFQAVYVALASLQCCLYHYGAAHMQASLTRQTVDHRADGQCRLCQKHSLRPYQNDMMPELWQKHSLKVQDINCFAVEYWADQFQRQCDLRTGKKAKFYAFQRS